MSLSNTYTMDAPIGETRLDRNGQGVIGRGIARFEGPLKVSGTAKYAFEQMAGGDVAYGYLVIAPIGAGKIKRIDPLPALSRRGVLHVVTDMDAPRASADPSDKKPQPIDGRVHYHGQPVCMVVAESFEIARDAARLVEVEYEAEDGRYDLAAVANEAFDPGEATMPSNVRKGDFDKAFAAAEVTFDATYTTPSQNSSAMEPHASIAVWTGDDLTLYGSYQLLSQDVAQLAAALGIPAKRIRLVAPYVGGGFGSKLGIAPESVFAALAAKAVGRPVKVALTRQQVYQSTLRRADTIQRVRLGTTRDGRITAIAHETVCGNLPGDGGFEPAGISTVFLYAGENRRITHRKADTNVVFAAAMRSPGEAVGMLALENAMDEMAERLGLDPIEFRRRNEPEVDPQEGLPFSSRRLLDCFAEGARRFDWSGRPSSPMSRREGEWFVGYGVASASRKNLLQQSAARVTLSPDGTALVETDMTDIGTGSYTILQQIAAEMLGLVPEAVTVKLGDSALPQASGSGGSWGANSSGSSVFAACEGIVAEIAKRLDVQPDDLTLKDGTVIARNHRRPVGVVVGDAPIVCTGTFKPGQAFKNTHQASYGAHFAEVRVNAVTGETRVKRLLTVAAAGRILNEKTATSQVYGGQIFGIGGALTEELVIDPRTGLMVNHDLAEYHVPVNADVQQLDVVLLPDRDAAASPLAGKGLGELALCGVGAAITNAIYNATGVRVRDYPMTLDKVLAGWAAQRNGAAVAAE